MINQIIFSEFSVRYDKIETVELLLPPEEFLRESLPWLSSFAAGPRLWAPIGATAARRSASYPIFSLVRMPICVATVF